MANKQGVVSPRASGVRGIMDFFKKRQKSSNNETEANESLSLDGNSASRYRSSTTSSPTECPLQKPLCPNDETSFETEGGTSTSYGNYLTISDTSANALQDLFRKKYLTSLREPLVTDEELLKSGSRSKKGSPVFKLFSKNIRGRRDSVSDRSAATRSLDFRERRELFCAQIKSRDPVESRGAMRGAAGSGIFPRLQYGSGIGVGAFFGSFRQRSNSKKEKHDEVVASGSSLSTEQSPVKLPLKKNKNKNFEVTPVTQDSTFAVDSQPIVPDEFGERYQKRSGSDPKINERYDAKAAVESYQVRLYRSSCYSLHYPINYRCVISARIAELNNLSWS